MYEYPDFYDEAEHGGTDGGAMFITRNCVISILKQHGHHTPQELLVFFRESQQLCVNRYRAASVLEWLNY